MTPSSINYAGLRQRENAKLLGIGTGGAVSAQLARLPELIRADRWLERKLRTAKDRLDEKRDEAGYPRKLLVISRADPTLGLLLRQSFREETRVIR